MNRQAGDKQKRLRRSGGMTMVEVIVAFAIVCLLALMAMSLMGVSFSMIRSGADFTRAGSAALSAVEQQRADNGPGNAGAVQFWVLMADHSHVVPGAYYAQTETQGGEEVTMTAFQPAAEEKSEISHTGGDPGQTEAGEGE